MQIEQWYSVDKTKQVQCYFQFKKNILSLPYQSHHHSIAQQQRQTKQNTKICISFRLDDNCSIRFDRDREKKCCCHWIDWSTNSAASIQATFRNVPSEKYTFCGFAIYLMMLAEEKALSFEELKFLERKGIDILNSWNKNHTKNNYYHILLQIWSKNGLNCRWQSNRIHAKCLLSILVLLGTFATNLSSSKTLFFVICSRRDENRTVNWFPKRWI